MSDATEPLLDAEDIQGNILPGFSRLQQHFVAFSSDDRTALQSVLAALPRPTTLATTLGHRDARKAAFLAGAGRPVRGDLWLNLALGPRATDALGAPQVRALDRAFDKGMRPSITGDPTRATLPDGRSNPAFQDNWLVGPKSKPVDLLLIFAHDDDVASLSRPIVEQVTRRLGAPPAFQETCALLQGEVEHFGFRDGVSQVGVRGSIIQDGEERLLTTRYNVPSRDDIDFAKPGQALVWPGQILTGQPSFAGDSPTLSPELANGSFMVLRCLRQDVEQFHADTAAIAQQLSARTGQPVSAEELRARIVGRYRSGAALMRALSRC